jgi:hypothetical protein
MNDPFTLRFFISNLCDEETGERKVEILVFLLEGRKFMDGVKGVNRNGEIALNQRMNDYFSLFFTERRDLLASCH